jgi:hypothetical protein
MVHLLLAPPRHPALGLTPQTPNVMLIRAEPLAHMPPWCPLLAAAAGTDSCARLAGTATGSASDSCVPCGRRLGGTGTGSPNRGHGGDAPRKKRNLSAPQRQLLRPQGRRGWRRPGTPRWGLHPRPRISCLHMISARCACPRGAYCWLLPQELIDVPGWRGHDHEQCICCQRSLREGFEGNRHRVP